MSENGKREPLDKFKINSREIEDCVIKALLEDGYSIEIRPGFEVMGLCGNPVPRGSVITVYRKGGRHDS